MTSRRCEKSVLLDVTDKMFSARTCNPPHKVAKKFNFQGDSRDPLGLAIRPMSGAIVCALAPERWTLLAGRSLLGLAIGFEINKIDLIVLILRSNSQVYTSYWILKDCLVYLSVYTYLLYEV